MEHGKVVIELGIGQHALVLQPCKINNFSNMVNIFPDKRKKTSIFRQRKSNGTTESTYDSNNGYVRKNLNQMQ
jgi:hypothetical protein